MIRFETPDGDETQNMAAALFGIANWIGRVPEHCRRILISPVDRPGLFGFTVDSCKTVPQAMLLSRALLHSPKTAAMSIGARLINARQETRQALMFARGGVPIERYNRWRQLHFRPFDPEGLDCNRIDAGERVHLHVLVSGAGNGKDIDRLPLIRSLRAQSNDQWSCTLLDDSPDAGEARFANRSIAVAAGVTKLASLLGERPQGLLVCSLAALDQLHPQALSILQHMAMAGPLAKLFYADEETQDDDGGYCDPVFKPDWSPILEANSAFLGKAVFWSRSAFENQPDVLASEFDGPEFRSQTLVGLNRSEIIHVRRILTVHPPAEARKTLPPRAVDLAAPSRIASTKNANIIVPNKDRLDLIREVVKGVMATTDHAMFNLIIVDNGSSDPAVLDFYQSIRSLSDCRIIDCRGKFNYSKMCNLAAAEAKGEVHVFLNNDISMPHRHWLAPLVDWATRPEIGAVGARLLFPNGRLQHGGVTIGMGGFADHTDHDAPGDYCGHFGRLFVPHEVSAVTGACLAVEARKFDRAGGFNEIDLPVELNDIDLCMRLNASGYQTIMCPQAELIHHQSASRGFSYRPFTRYARERAYFQRRWVNELRDDPFFHPALSLFSTTPALEG